MKVSVVIPAYNEESRVGAVVKAAKKYGNVIVVDDGSSDKTAEVARKNSASVIVNKKNLGVAASTIIGFKKALAMGADVIITMDADGQHDADDIPKFIARLDEGYDFVLGQRILKDYPFKKRVGNIILTSFTNMLSHTRLLDTECGFRAYKRNAIKKILPHLKSERYLINADIIFEVGKNKIKHSNIPVNYPVYLKGKGYKTRYGFETAFFLLKKRFSC